MTSSADATKVVLRPSPSQTTAAALAAVAGKSPSSSPALSSASLSPPSTSAPLHHHHHTAAAAPVASTPPPVPARRSSGSAMRGLAPARLTMHTTPRTASLDPLPAPHATITSALPDSFLTGSALDSPATIEISESSYAPTPTSAPPSAVGAFRFPPPHPVPASAAVLVTKTPEAATPVVSSPWATSVLSDSAVLVDAADHSALGSGSALAPAAEGSTPDEIITLALQRNLPASDVDDEMSSPEPSPTKTTITAKHRRISAWAAPVELRDAPLPVEPEESLARARSSSAILEPVAVHRTGNSTRSQPILPSSSAVAAQMHAASASSAAAPLDPPLLRRAGSHGDTPKPRSVLSLVPSTSLEDLVSTLFSSARAANIPTDDSPPSVPPLAVPGASADAHRPFNLDFYLPPLSTGGAGSRSTIAGPAMSSSNAADTSRAIHPLAHILSPPLPAAPAPRVASPPPPVSASVVPAPAPAPAPVPAQESHEWTAVAQDGATTTTATLKRTLTRQGSMSSASAVFVMSATTTTSSNIGVPDAPLPLPPIPVTSPTIPPAQVLSSSLETALVSPTSKSYLANLPGTAPPVVRALEAVESRVHARCAALEAENAELRHQVAALTEEMAETRKVHQMMIRDLYAKLDALQQRELLMVADAAGNAGLGLGARPRTNSMGATMRAGSLMAVREEEGRGRDQFDTLSSASSATAVAPERAGSSVGHPSATSAAAAATAAAALAAAKAKKKRAKSASSRSRSRLRSILSSTSSVSSSSPDSPVSPHAPAHAALAPAHPTRPPPEPPVHASSPQQQQEKKRPVSLALNSLTAAAGAAGKEVDQHSVLQRGGSGGSSKASKRRTWADKWVQVAKGVLRPQHHHHHHHKHGALPAHLDDLESRPSGDTAVFGPATPRSIRAGFPVAAASTTTLAGPAADSDGRPRAWSNEFERAAAAAGHAGDPWPVTTAEPNPTTTTTTTTTVTVALRVSTDSARSTPSTSSNPRRWLDAATLPSLRSRSSSMDSLGSAGVRAAAAEDHPGRAVVLDWHDRVYYEACLVHDDLVALAGPAGVAGAPDTRRRGVMGAVALSVVSMHTAVAAWPAAMVKWLAGIEQPTSPAFGGGGPLFRHRHAAATSFIADHDRVALAIADDAWPPVAHSRELAGMFDAHARALAGAVAAHFPGVDAPALASFARHLAGVGLALVVAMAACDPAASLFLAGLGALFDPTRHKPVALVANPSRRPLMVAGVLFPGLAIAVADTGSTIGEMAMATTASVASSALAGYDLVLVKARVQVDVAPEDVIPPVPPLPQAALVLHDVVVVEPEDEEVHVEDEGVGYESLGAPEPLAAAMDSDDDDDVPLGLAAQPRAVVPDTVVRDPVINDPRSPAPVPPLNNAVPLPPLPPVPEPAVDQRAVDPAPSITPSESRSSRHAAESDLVRTFRRVYALSSRVIELSEPATPPPPVPLTPAVVDGQIVFAPPHPPLLTEAAPDADRDVMRHHLLRNVARALLEVHHAMPLPLDQVHERLQRSIAAAVPVVAHHEDGSDRSLTLRTSSSTLGGGGGSPSMHLAPVSPGASSMMAASLVSAAAPAAPGDHHHHHHHHANADRKRRRCRAYLVKDSARALVQAHAAGVELFEASPGTPVDRTAHSIRGSEVAGAEEGGVVEQTVFCGLRRAGTGRVLVKCRYLASVDAHLLGIRDAHAAGYLALANVNVQILNTTSDRGVEDGAAVFAAVKAVKANVAGILGGGTSDAARQISLVTSVYNVPICSFIAVSSQLSDKAAYPWLYRFSLGAHTTGRAMLQYAQRVGWRRMAVVYEAGYEFIKDVVRELDDRGPDYGVSVVTKTMFGNTDMGKRALDAIYDALVTSDAYIVAFVHLTPNGARVLDHLHRRGWFESVYLGRPRVLVIVTNPLGDVLNQFPGLHTALLAKAGFVKPDALGLPPKAILNPFAANYTATTGAPYPYPNVLGFSAAYACGYTMVAGLHRLAWQYGGGDMALLEQRDPALFSHLALSLFNETAGRAAGVPMRIDEDGDVIPRGFAVYSIYPSPDAPNGIGYGTCLEVPNLNGTDMPSCPFPGLSAGAFPVDATPRVAINNALGTSGGDLIIGLACLTIVIMAALIAGLVWFRHHRAVSRTPPLLATFLLLSITFQIASAFADLGIPTPTSCLVRDFTNFFAAIFIIVPILGRLVLVAWVTSYFTRGTRQSRQRGRQPQQQTSPPSSTLGRLRNAFPALNRLSTISRPSTLSLADLAPAATTGDAGHERHYATMLAHKRALEGVATSNKDATRRAYIYRLVPSFLVYAALIVYTLGWQCPSAVSAVPLPDWRTEYKCECAGPGGDGLDRTYGYSISLLHMIHAAVGLFLAARMRANAFNGFEARRTGLALFNGTIMSFISDAILVSGLSNSYAEYAPIIQAVNLFASTSTVCTYFIPILFRAYTRPDRALPAESGKPGTVPLAASPTGNRSGHITTASSSESESGGGGRGQTDDPDDDDAVLVRVSTSLPSSSTSAGVTAGAAGVGTGAGGTIGTTRSSPTTSGPVDLVAAPAPLAVPSIAVATLRRGGTLQRPRVSSARTYAQPVETLPRHAPLEPSVWSAHAQVCQVSDATLAEVLAAVPVDMHAGLRRSTSAYRRRLWRRVKEPTPARVWMWSTPEARLVALHVGEERSDQLAWTGPASAFAAFAVPTRATSVVLHGRHLRRWVVLELDDRDAVQAVIDACPTAVESPRRVEPRSDFLSVI
ncbi:hypothetical protein H9P43_003590 [Blastocladiella emersonii ATCC 22665]|nr:hypothetical protein H9P43_003590 [Blastocladiella emersonii ATCC 22665]